MSDSTDATLKVFRHPVPCPTCGYYVAPDTMQCPQCGTLIEAQPEFPPTTELVRRPHTFPASNPRTALTKDVQVILQFLPSAHCVTLDLSQPVVLGRGALPGSDSLIDLSDYGARQHGVSRRHCLLQRHGQFLVAVDLGSVNGTHLNGVQLEPKQAVVVASGDRLVLGTLHVLITFHQRVPRE